MILSANTEMSVQLPGSENEYDWPVIPRWSFDDIPVVVSDLDGTLRGDVTPMVRMAGLLVPNFLQKLKFREPWRLRKVLWFLFGLARLWVLRTLNREHRRRYKYLFSELHTLAAALLTDIEIGLLRRTYQETLPTISGLWYPEAINLLRRLTAEGRVVLVTGSEQIQTEECVRLLERHGVDISRIHVHGSLYGVNSETSRFNGTIKHLNVTLEGKREALASYTKWNSTPFSVALGNSRPDRALFEAVPVTGLRVLVCRTSVLQHKMESSFVVRKLNRSGSRVMWDENTYLSEVANIVEQLSQPTEFNKACFLVPILATDSRFQVLAQSSLLADAYSTLAAAAMDSRNLSSSCDRSRSA